MALAINVNQDVYAVRTLTHQRSRENALSIHINHARSLKSKKCLFGPANPDDTDQMVKENLDQERQRFFMRFGVHIEDLDRLTIDEDEYKRQQQQQQRPRALTLEAAQQQQQQQQYSGVGGGKVAQRKLMRMKRILKPYNAMETSRAQTKITDFCPVKKSPTSDDQACKKTAKLIAPLPTSGTH